MQRVRKFFKSLGPGFISGAADDDPTAIATYTQAGAQFGYSQSWTALFTFPFMAAIQEMCGRIGMVTGKGLSGVIKHNFPAPVLYFAVLILFVSNIVNISADLGAMAGATKLVLPVPFPILLLAITAITLLLEVFVSYPAYAKFLKVLTLSLLAYVAVALIVKQDWSKILVATLVPYISSDKAYILNLVAILGTNLSPYLFFWQADEEVEEEVVAHKIRSMGRGVPKIRKYDLDNMRTDTIIGMFFSNVIVFFVGISAAATLGKAGIVNVQSANDAAQALLPIAGSFASVLFALAIIGSGLLAVPILAGSAGYAVSEAFGWREGLSRKFSQAHGFYGAIAVATLIGLFINFLSVKPFTLLYYSAALNGILAPALLVIILIIANNKSIMGGRTNGWILNVMGIVIITVMSVSSVFLLYNLIT